MMRSIVTGGDSEGKEDVWHRGAKGSALRTGVMASVSHAAAPPEFFRNSKSQFCSFSFSCRGFEV
ncbi:hypothetical protein TIFTF001_035107 [Ficus carica]|uniref:Uncharacterized protein n=1 Tax=Ficus carica TaxID=3494 RepID=A0AA88J618_FICCA|nr:hypothetical protein TIFTF001_035107 [Ficus carica]